MMFKVARTLRVSLLRALILVPVFAVSLFSQNGGLPPGSEEAKARLDTSPRHAEWVVIEEDGDRINSWLVYPERSDSAPVVIVIHEIFGLTDWIRSVADQLAADGFIAIAPDLVSGKGPGGGDTDSMDRDEVVRQVRGLDRSEVLKRLNSVARYATSLPAASDRFAVIGYCWGGATSFWYATEQPKLGAAVVFYGSSAETETLSRIHAPILGLYGEDDARVNATIAPAEEEMKRLGKVFEFEIYPGAGHGFLRAQEGRDGANLKASEQAWPRTVQFLRRHLEK